MLFVRLVDDFAVASVINSVSLEAFKDSSFALPEHGITLPMSIINGRTMLISLLVIESRPNTSNSFSNSTIEEVLGEHTVYLLLSMVTSRFSSIVSDFANYGFIGLACTLRSGLPELEVELEALSSGIEFCFV